MVHEKSYLHDAPTAEHPRPAAAATLLALMHAQGEVERLSEREQLLSSLLVSVNAVLWAIDWETRRVLYVSPAYERIFGRSAGLLLADHREWRNSIHPEDLDYAEHSMARVLEQGAVEDREYRIITADGQIRWLSDKCYINQQVEPGEPVIVVGMAEDITEKKQMELELHRLATTDVLTQSSNRRHFFECANQAFDSACAQGRRWLSCCWTSMISRTSTTPTATWKAIRCSGVSPKAVAVYCAVATCSGALAARNSPPYCQAAHRKWRCKWPSAWAGRFRS